MKEAMKRRTNKPLWKFNSNFNTNVAIFFIVFSIVFYLLIPYQIASPKILIGRTLVGMTPTLFPRLTIIGLLCLSVLYLILSPKLDKNISFKEEIEKRNLTKSAVIFVIIIAYTFLFESLGFVISSALTAAAVSLFLGNRNIFILLVVTILIPISIFFIFTSVLYVSLPRGLL